MKKLTQFVMAAACAGGIGFASSAVALDGGALYMDPTKGGCSACHGKDANTPIMPSYPKLAGQNADYAFNQMKDIQSGKRNNGMTAAMKGITHLTTDEEKKAIAEWLSKQ
ncbi:MAG: c-type cytochrome [Gammaproteobacteria bacterium]|nr:c-type cytochrome [Gammaproteobacteria bacterium]